MDERREHQHDHAEHTMTAPTGHPEHDQHAAHDAHAAHDLHAADDAHAGHGGDTSGHGGHAGHGDHVGQFRRLFWVMLVISVPVIAFSPMFAMLLGYALPDAAFVTWISPVLGTVMYVWGGRPFLTGA